MNQINLHAVIIIFTPGSKNTALPELSKNTLQKVSNTPANSQKNHVNDKSSPYPHDGSKSFFYCKKISVKSLRLIITIGDIVYSSQVKCLPNFNLLFAYPWVNFPSRLQNSSQNFLKSLLPKIYFSWNHNNRTGKFCLELVPLFQAYHRKPVSNAGKKCTIPFNTNSL